MDNYDRTEEFLIHMKEKINEVIRKKKRTYFNVKNENLHEIVNYLFHIMGCRLSTATALETYDGVEVLYQFSHDLSGCFFCPRVIIKDKTNPTMLSITPIIKGAEWIEREMKELWGIEFEGHPKPEPLLTGNHPEEIRMPFRYGRTL